jgi:hypothetical protein
VSIIPDVVKQFWSCGLPGHQHATVGEASDCWDSRSSAVMEQRRAEEVNRRIYDRAGPPER